MASLSPVIKSKKCRHYNRDWNKEKWICKDCPERGALDTMEEATIRNLEKKKLGIKLR